jgi:hypothetical protein
MHMCILKYGFVVNWIPCNLFKTLILKGLYELGKERLNTNGIDSGRDLMQSPTLYVELTTQMVRAVGDRSIYFADTDLFFRIARRIRRTSGSTRLDAVTEAALDVLLEALAPT